MFNSIFSLFKVRKAVFTVTARNESTQDIEVMTVQARCPRDVDIEDAEVQVKRNSTRQGLFVISMQFEKIIAG